jgi:hypothetical protein
VVFDGEESKMKNETKISQTMISTKKKAPKFDKFVVSLTKTLILKSYARNVIIASKLREMFNVKTRKAQKKKLKLLDIEKEDYDFYSKLL